jgi:hypothetical protein
MEIVQNEINVLIDSDGRSSAVAAKCYQEGGHDIMRVHWLLGAAASSLLFSLSASDASAQSPVPAEVPPTCSQPMIAGSWQALFPNPHLGFTLVCSLTVSTTGTIGDGACDIGSFTHGSWILTQPPLGTLTINGACRVIGAISYTVCSQPPCSSPRASITVQNQALLWRSRDGSRISGFMQWTPGEGLVQYYPLDLIATE